ncbi:MAG: hypothetical protein A2583_07950 [Bdellovibrionales bacterium RIFOXYD1_FULL_53_11]|nr:MAG: hypothetical protein A2583_07950 [Bdellovibrionales bacterium RIFOXYD1_FULL_53_11]
MRKFCWTCHRPAAACFCGQVLEFESSAGFALIVHPHEVRSTVGTAWIMRRSISNIKWFRSKGIGLDEDPEFLSLLGAPDAVPLLLFPGPQAFNLSHGRTEEWQSLVPAGRRPLFFVVDGTWTEARAMLRKSRLLSALPRVSFETPRLSEYGFKKQPHPGCLSSVEGVHLVIELLAQRGWGTLPALREHDRMIGIFRNMVRHQLQQVVTTFWSCR